MHEPSFTAGLELGKFVTRLRTLEIGHSALRKEFDAFTGKMRRGIILAALWTFALLANISTDRAAEFAVEIVMSAWKR